MADVAKTVAKLVVSGDGRTADNWSSYKLQLENALSDKQTAGFFLDDVLLNKGDAALTDPGTDSATWIAANTGNTVADFNAAVKQWSNLARANRVTHSCIMATLPTVLHEECCQHPIAHELWFYLNDRFAGQTLVSAAALWMNLTTLKLDDHPGVSAFLTALTKTEMEIERATETKVPPSLLAGIILNGMGTRFPTTRELLLQYDLGKQNKDDFGLALLNAEKNAQVMADRGAIAARVTPTAPVNAYASTPGRACTYVRQKQGRSPYAAPGQVCARFHKGNTCFMKWDDEWLMKNPTKTAADLPNWMDELKKGRDIPFRGKAHVNASVAQPRCDEITAAAVTLSGAFLDYSGAVGQVSHPTEHSAEALSSLPHSTQRFTVALDSGATATCLKQKMAYKPLSQPVPVTGASEGMTTVAHGTSTIPCPALPGKELTGIYSPSFRHNLISLKDLQTEGVQVVFPAYRDIAECQDPATGEVLWQFQQGPSGLSRPSWSAGNRWWLTLKQLLRALAPCMPSNTRRFFSTIASGTSVKTTSVC